MDKEGQAAAAASGVPGPPILKALEDLLITLRKSSKDLAFYPPGHPLLTRSLERAAEQLHAVVGARPPLSLAVSRSGFTFEGQPVGKENRQLATMAAELFVRRIQKIFIAQEVGPEELAGFLRMITSDPKQLVQQGGPAKVLAAHGVGRIQVNEFDFRRVGTAAGAAGRAGGPAGRGPGEAGEPGVAGSGQGAGPGGSGTGTGAPGVGGSGQGAGPGGSGTGGPAAGESAAGGPTGATASAGAGIVSPPGGMTSPDAGAASGALPGDQAAGLQGAEATLTHGGAAGQGLPAAAKGGEQAGQGPVTPESLIAALGSQKELTLEALIQRLEQEAASGGAAAYEWAASRLEKAAGQAVHDDWPQDVLAVLRVFLRHQRAGELKESLRERAAQAVETVSGGNTVAYLVEHLRTGVGESAEVLPAVLVDLGTRAIPQLLSRLATEDQDAARERLVATLARFCQVAQPDLTRALQGLEPERASQSAPVLAAIGGETGVILLTCLFRHRDPRVRSEAVRELGRFNEPAAPRLLMQALRDPDPAVLEVAVSLVGTAKLRLATPTLLRLAGQRVLTGGPFAVRKAAVAALGAMGDAGTVPILRGLLYARTWFQRAAGDELRQAAALALLAMGRPEAREVVVAGARSRRGDVRRACAAALRAAPAQQ